MGATNPPTPGGQRNTIIGVTTIIGVVVLIIIAALWFQKLRAAKSQQGDDWTEADVTSARKRMWSGANIRGHHNPRHLSVIQEEEGIGLDDLPLAPQGMPAKPLPILLLTRPTQRDSLVQQKGRYYQKA